MLAGRATPAARLRIALLNPNANRAATAMMLALARKALPAGSGGRVTIAGRTVAEGPALISDEAALAAAVPRVVAAGLAWAAAGPRREESGGGRDGLDGLDGFDGGGFDALIVAGFGDPGVAELAARLSVPVVGIGGAGMAEAAAGGRRFSIVTVTPALRASLQRAAAVHGYGEQLASIRFTDGDPAALAADPIALAAALHDGCRAAIERDGAEAVLIGGGPLAQAARALADRIGSPVIDPVGAAVRRILSGAFGASQRP